MKIVELATLRPAAQPNLLFLRLHTDDGIVGLGESFFGPRAVEAYLHETAADVLLAATDPTPEGIARQLAPYVGYQGAGAETRGNAAIDLALWDILGQRSGLPLAELLGGPASRSVRVYNTCAGSGYVGTSSRQRSDKRPSGRSCAPGTTSSSSGCRRSSMGTSARRGNPATGCGCARGWPRANR